MKKPEVESGPPNALADWLDEVSGPEWIWFVKILSANDTYAKANVHQGGPYVAKEVLRVVFPLLSKRANTKSNPDLPMPTTIGIGSDETTLDLRLIWYNSKRLGQSNGRDEARLTRWGGLGAPVVSPESTGSLTIFAYHQPSKTKDADALRVWVARGIDDEDQITARVGPVEPGTGLVVTPTGLALSAPARMADRPCWLEEEELPASWRKSFPSGEEIIRAVIDRLPTVQGTLSDNRLLRRRDCEYEVFRSVEQYYVLPRLQEKFATVDLFLSLAHSVTNRRKSRSGKSLELHLSAIFREDDLLFTNGAKTEGARRPDFIFPSIEKYFRSSWPSSKLRMLGAKTTVKDRWRQILNEARRVERKHLLTLQEGVSVEQFREMQDEGVTLVVPKPLQKHYPAEVVPDLISLSRFIDETRSLCSGLRDTLKIRQ